MIGKGKPLYHVERFIMESDELFDDGSHIVYVNGAYRDDTPLGKLMHDFSCTQPSEMHYKILADRARYFKENKEGVAIMCKAMEDMRNQTLKEGMIDVAKRLLEEGTLSVEKIAECVKLSVEEVIALQSSKAE